MNGKVPKQELEIFLRKPGDRSEINSHLRVSRGRKKWKIKPNHYPMSTPGVNIGLTQCSKKSIYSPVVNPRG